MRRRHARSFLLTAAVVSAAAVTPGLLSAQRHGGGGHSGGGHSGGSGGGVPCGRSYISASKTCHVGEADVPTTAPGVDTAAPRAALQPLSGPTRPVSYDDAVAAVDGAARTRCAEDSAAALAGRRARLPECLRSAASVTDSVDAHSTLQDQRRYAGAPLRLLVRPDPAADVLAVVPRGAALTVSSCTLGPGAWCLASYHDHNGYTSRDLVTGATSASAASASAASASAASASAASASAATRPRVGRHAGPAHASMSRVASPHPYMGVGGSRHPGYYVGPRGGCYTYSASGRKRYVDHSHCG